MWVSNCWFSLYLYPCWINNADDTPSTHNENVHMEKLYKDGGVHGANDNGEVEVTLCGLQAHDQGTIDHAKPPLNTPPTTTPPTPKRAAIQKSCSTSKCL